MTQERDIELALERWFTEGPTQMPDRFLDDTLDRIDRAPRRRFAGLRTRSSRIDPLLRFVLAAAVVVTVVGAGAGILIKTGGLVGAPAGAGLLPTAGQSEWRSVGSRVHPTPSGVDRPTDLDIVFGPTTLTIFEWHGDVHNSARVVGADRLELRMLDDPVVTWPVAGGTELRPVWPCHVGDTGTYRFSLSSGGRHLTLISESDACAARATILAGDWVLTDIGDIHPGRHEALDFRPFGGGTGRLAYTLPPGWVGADMQDGLFSMSRPSVSDQARISLISNAFASDQAAPCDENRGAAGVGRTPAALADWLRTLPGLVVSAPTDVTIGGLSGVVVDLSVAPGWTPTCDAGLYTFSLSGSANGGWSSRLSLGGTGRARYILLDRGDGSSLVMVIEAPSSTWDDFLADADLAIDGLEFTP